jgi:tetratricopeptide (TPR) repeat protein
MRNWNRCPGVYCNKSRVALILIASTMAMAQQGQTQDPIDAAVQEVYTARAGGHFEEAARAREKADALLQRVPIDAPQFAGWVQQVAQLYRDSGLRSQSRAVLQGALAQTAALPDWHPARVAMLNALADSWQQEGNLLKAVGLLEQLAVAQPAASRAPKKRAEPGSVIFFNAPHRELFP